MKLITALLATILVSPAFAGTYVAPHVRSDGTFVQGHMRSEANSTKTDNYSTKGNTNPYTGKKGTEDDSPSYKSPSYEPPKPYTLPNPYDTTPRRSR